MSGKILNVLRAESVLISSSVTNFSDTTQSINDYLLNTNFTHCQTHLGVKKGKLHTLREVNIHLIKQGQSLKQIICNFNISFVISFFLPSIHKYLWRTYYWYVLNTFCALGIQCERKTSSLLLWCSPATEECSQLIGNKNIGQYSF